MLNNSTSRIACLAFLLLFNHVGGNCQDEMFHAQSIMKHEFLNPAYNSYRDYTSISLVSREQWRNTIIGSPEIYAASIYAPLKLSSLGIGLVAISETIGLRDKLSVLGTIAHNVRISNNSYLAFGYGLGIEGTTYDRERIIRQDSQLDIYSIELNYYRTIVSLGLFYLSPAFFAGISSNMLIGKDNSEGDKWLLPGFDLSVGAMYQLRRGIMFRPEVEMKYYSINSIVYDNMVKEVSTFEPIYDLSLSFLFGNRVWFGTSRRLKHSHAFSFDVIIKERFKLGYTYEIGIGDGFNRFDSQGIRVAWNFIPKPTLRGFDVGDRRLRRSNMASSLYK